MDAILPPQPRRLRMQFGLRTAIVLMTLAAIGVAMWTRWPYAVEEKIAQPLWREGSVNALTNRNATLIAQREAAYYRRLLGGDRVRQGESQLFLANDERAVKRHFREGVLHGVYREWYSSGAPRCAGSYNLGRKHGPWLFLGQPTRDQAHSDYRRTQNWHLGVPHGEWKWEDGYGTVYLHVMYDTGRVKTIDGESVVDYLDDICRQLPSGAIFDRWRQFQRFQAHGGYPDWMLDPLSPSPSIEIEYDPRLPPLKSDGEPNLLRSIPYAVAFASDLRNTRRAATRRYNCLYITLPELLEPKHDLTGVGSLEPGSDSLVALMFAKNVELSSRETNFNFRQALHYFEHEIGLPIDDSALDGTLEPRDEDRSWAPLGWYKVEHNVRDLLGLALHRARCRCELMDGVLVIKRQEK